MAMRHTNSLLRAQLTEIQRLACNSSSQWLLRRKLETLLHHQLDDRQVRTELLTRMIGLLEHVGPGAGRPVRARRPRRIAKSPART